MTEKVTLGYWGIRGRAQIARLLLAYTGAVWEDVKYTSPEQWFGKDKQGLGIPFANLPYLIDGDFKLSESRAIVKYIVARSGNKELEGKNIQDQARVLQVSSVLEELAVPLGSLFFDPQWETKLPAVLEKAVPKINLVNEFYGEKEFALGYLTLIDFVVSEISYIFEKIAPEVYAKNPFFARTRAAFENLPQIKNYYAQETATKGPFVPPTAVIQI